MMPLLLLPVLTSLLLSQQVMLEKLYPPLRGRGMNTVIAHDSLHVLVFSSGYALRTTDGGINWKEILPPSSKFVSFFGVATGAQDTLGWTFWSVWRLRNDSLHQVYDYEAYGSNTESVLVASCFVLDTTCWYIGGGRIIEPGGNQREIFRLLRSCDRGGTWEQLARIDTMREIIALHFFNLQEGIALIATEQYKNGEPYPLYYTTDGGYHWTQARAPSMDVPIPLASLHFTASLDGKVWLAAGEKLLVSSNRGMSWDSVSSWSEYRGQNSFKNIVWLDSLTGFITGTYWRRQYNRFNIPQLLQTTDGGKTWNPIVIPAHLGEYGQGGSPDPEILPLSIGRDATMWLATNRGMLLRRRPAMEWEKIIPSTEDLYGIQALSDSVLIAWGWGSSVIGSTDGGVRWRHLFPVDTTVRMSYASFANPAEGIIAYIEGNTTRMYRTTEGGKQWQRLSLPEQMQSSGIRAILHLNSTTVLARYPKEWYRSTDAGSSWQLDEEMSDYYTPLSVRVLPSGDILAAHPFYVYHSSDSGNSWQLRATRPSYSINEEVLAFDGISDQSFAYCVKLEPTPDSVAIYLQLTTDAGTTWTEELIVKSRRPTLPTVAYIVMVDAEKIVYWGNPGPPALRLSANNWQELTLPRYATAQVSLTRGLTRSPSGTVWIAGDNSTILRLKLPSISRVAEPAKQRTTDGILLTSGKLELSAPVQRAWLFDVTGRCIRSWGGVCLEAVDLSDIPAGFYVLLQEIMAGHRTSMPVMIVK